MILTVRWTPLILQCAVVFRFVEVTAESQLGMLDDVLGDKSEEAKERLRNLNAEIENVQELNSHYHIGPSYFRNFKRIGYDYELLWSDYLNHFWKITYVVLMKRLKLWIY